MGLFSKAQAAKIMATAKKSKAPVKPAQKKVNTKTITAEIARISKEVIEYFKDSKAELITTKEQLHDYVSKMIEAGIGGIDTETTGLDRVHDTIVGTSLYYPSGVEVYIPINHIIPIFNEPYKNQLSYEDVGKEYARFIEAKTKLIFANADFDLGFMFKDMHVDLITCCFFDVIIAWRCLKEDEKSNALKVLYAKYVLGGKGDPKRFSDFFTPELFPYCDPNVAKLYAANDAKITYELFMWQLPYIKKDNPLCKKHGFEALSDLIWNVEIPMIAVAQKMHRQGMFIEKEVSDMLIHKYHKLLDDANLKLQSMIDEVMNGGQYVSRTKPPFHTPQEFNPNSSKHVEWLAYDLIGLNDGRSKGTDKEVLKTFNNPILNQILYCRSLVTLISTFVDKIPESVADDHRIHCTFKTIGADCVTGDTLIPTSNGYMYIKDLCEISESNPENHVNYETPVTIFNMNQLAEDAVSCITYKNVPTIKLNLSYGLTIEGTYNHPVMVSQYTQSDYSRNKSNKMYRTMWENRRFKPLDAIQIGDILEVPCDYICGGSYQETGLNLMDFRNLNNLAPSIPKYYDEDFAEFLGMYHADGTSGFRTGTFRIALHNCNNDVIQRFKYLSKILFNLDIKNYTQSNRVNESSSYINCKALGELNTILPKGANNKKIPEAIYRSPRSVINAYIRGMTLDSSVQMPTRDSDNIRFELNVTNEMDAHFVQQHLISQGILSSIVRHSYKKDGSVLYRLKFSADNYSLFSEMIGFIETDKMHIGYKNKRSMYKNIRSENSFKVYVKSIEYKTNDVYDFHIPGTHSFISNGIISHNTGRMSSADPNLQNIPSRQSDIRHMFRASPGYVLMSSDFSQQEPKLTAYVSQDENMIRSFQEGKDIYSFIASIAFNKPYEDCLEFTPDGEYNPEGKARRTESKSVVLGRPKGTECPPNRSIISRLLEKETL